MNGLRNALAHSGTHTLRELAGQRRTGSLRRLLADEAEAEAAAEATRQASAAIARFHAEQLGILVVGSPVGDTQAVGAGSAHVQRYEFGSILKPLNEPPAFATRYAAVISIAAIKCFGTDDPSGTDEPYIVSAVYAFDPQAKEHALQTSEIHFGSVDEKSIFAVGHPLTTAPMFIPGDGHIQVVISLWDEEEARPSALQDTWRQLATEAIIAGLTLVNPAIGAGAAALETAKGIVKDASREMITAVSDLLGIADDHLATHEFTISADFLKRLIDSHTGMPRTSESIPGIRYNFPEFKESADAEGHLWLFEGGGGSYRLFFSVQASEVQFSPLP